MLDKIAEKKHFYNIYISLLLVAAMTVSVLKAEVAGAIVFGVLAAASLVLFSDPVTFLVPTLLLSVFVTVCYDSFDTFIKFIPLAIPLAACIIFNLIKYRKKVKPGKSFWGIAAVAVAVTLGGVGYISPKDYFSPTSLFYVVALGGGMLLLYLFFASRLKENAGENIAKTMYAVGILAVFMIALFYIRNWEEFRTSYMFAKFQYSNNLSTFLLFAMPFPMYFARRRHIDFIATLIMYVAIIFSTSRGGAIMGSVEILVLFFAYAVFYEKKILKKLLYFGIIISGVAIFIHFAPHLLLKLSSRSLLNDPEAMTLNEFVDIAKVYFVSPQEPRIALFLRAIEDIKANPLFGVGLGYSGNTDLYSPVSGAMNWYHMWTAQIMGSMGIVGIAAYGYQLVHRVVIFFQNRSPLNMTLLLSYFGLWLMSQVNPGEFCPIPYTFIAVIYFIIIERKSNEATTTVSRV